MTLAYRRTIFILFVLIFLVVTPGVLLYANGYSFDWESAKLIKTGSFYFDTLPEEAEVFVNGKLKGVSPAYLNRLVPGQYLIEIKKEGFSTWKKNLEIQPQIMTEARNVFLVPEKPKIALKDATASSTEDYFMTSSQRSIRERAELTASSTIKDVASWQVYNNNIYYLQKANLVLFKSDLNGLEKTQLSLDPLPETKNPYQLKILAEQIMVFEPDGNLYLFNTDSRSFKLIAQNVREAEFSSDNGKILFYNPHEIWVYWLDNVYSQPYRLPGDKKLISRFGGLITRVIWLPVTNEHLIYSIDQGSEVEKIFITELDDRDARNTYEIYTAKKPQLHYSEKENLLYVLTENNLFSLDLLASSN